MSATLRFLGTGASGGTPGRGRSRRLESSLLLERDSTVLIDVTRDFAEQSKAISHLDTILLTHAHADAAGRLDGVLKSWAIPKGPSTNPKDKRLAMPTEDHPLEYADFEGVIPEGQYGAGTVIVWDKGTYRNLTESDGERVPIGDALSSGHVKFWLEGRKLKGGYALTRIGKGKDGRWLLVKERDSEADARRKPVKSQPESVLSGRTIEGIAGSAR